MKSFLKAIFWAIIIIGIITTIVFFGLGFYLSPQSTLAKSDAIVAVSGGETRSRALEAIRLYKEGWAPKLIFSGAALDPSGPSNARAMQKIALEADVPAEAIILDEASTNTIQNATGVAALLKENQYHKIILVTSPYHQRRASITFRAALGGDIVILNHSTTDQNWRRGRWWANDYSKAITLAELQKTIYVLWAGTKP